MHFLSYLTPLLVVVLLLSSDLVFASEGSENRKKSDVTKDNKGIASKSATGHKGNDDGDEAENVANKNEAADAEKAEEKVTEATTVKKAPPKKRSMQSPTIPQTADPSELLNKLAKRRETMDEKEEQTDGKASKEAPKTDSSATATGDDDKQGSAPTTSTIKPGKDDTKSSTAANKGKTSGTKSSTVSSSQTLTEPSVTATDKDTKDGKSKSQSEAKHEELKETDNPEDDPKGTEKEERDNKKNKTAKGGKQKKVEGQDVTLQEGGKSNNNPAQNAGNPAGAASPSAPAATAAANDSWSTGTKVAVFGSSALIVLFGGLGAFYVVKLRGGKPKNPA